jgi:hypothetical protein
MKLCPVYKCQYLHYPRVKCYNFSYLFINAILAPLLFTYSLLGVGTNHNLGKLGETWGNIYYQTIVNID